MCAFPSSNSFGSSTGSHLGHRQVDDNVGDAEEGAGEEKGHGEVGRENGNSQVAAEDQNEKERVGEYQLEAATQHDDHCHKSGRQVGDVHQQAFCCLVFW